MNKSNMSKKPENIDSLELKKANNRIKILQKAGDNAVKIWQIRINNLKKEIDQQHYINMQLLNTISQQQDLLNRYQTEFIDKKIKNYRSEFSLKIVR